MLQVYVFIGIFSEGFNRIIAILKPHYFFAADELNGRSAEALFCRKN